MDALDRLIQEEEEEDIPPLPPVPPPHMLPGPVAIESEPIVSSLKKCCVRGCPGRTTPMVNCSNPDCTKSFHLTCFLLVLVAKKGIIQCNDPLNESKRLSSCSKTCMKKVEKLFIHVPKTAPWSKDGKLGPMDPNTSEYFLIKWLLVEGNHNAFRGKNNGGKTKIAFAKELAAQIKELEVRVERTPSAVLKQIEAYEKKFKCTDDWANNTGEGAKERDGEAVFEELCRSKFLHHFDLLPTMKSRASTRPAVTTENLAAVRDKVNRGETVGEDDNGDEEQEDGESPPDTEADDDGGGKPAAQPTKRAPATNSSNESTKRSNKKKKMTRQDSDSISTMQSLVEAKAVHKAEELEETGRHNKAMEELEQQKTEKAKWESKQQQLEHAKQLMTQKVEFTRMGHTPKRIVTMCPDMRPLFDPEELASDHEAVEHDSDGDSIYGQISIN